MAQGIVFSISPISAKKHHGSVTQSEKYRTEDIFRFQSV